MIMPNPKKVATVIVSKMRDGHETHQEVKPEEAIDEHHEALKAIAEDIMHAMESKSAHSLATAMKAFIAHHESADDREVE